jgi:hypothetical protein
MKPVAELMAPSTMPTMRTERLRRKATGTEGVADVTSRLKPKITFEARVKRQTGIGHKPSLRHALSSPCHIVQMRQCEAPRISARRPASPENVISPHYTCDFYVLLTLSNNRRPTPRDTQAGFCNSVIVSPLIHNA